LSFQLLVQRVVGIGDGRTPTGARLLAGADHCD
jgi:hypothetical protein